MEGVQYWARAGRQGAHGPLIGIRWDGGSPGTGDITCQETDDLSLGTTAARDFRLAADTHNPASCPPIERLIDSPRWPLNPPRAFPPTFGHMCRHSTASARQAWAPACGSS
ncbi:hypothetical protein FJTKL_11583 [Diaporthe vaccinii]|uniref:Uncharacterized protein n=1 Tax=Diaporthe vaccinii TaxID=105482 RepID=A0ABR4EG49_9PEZI